MLLPMGLLLELACYGAATALAGKSILGHPLEDAGETASQAGGHNSGESPSGPLRRRRKGASNQAAQHHASVGSPSRRA